MASSFKYVRGDTGPQIKITLTEEDTNNPVDLTAATITLHFRAAGEDAVLFSREFWYNVEEPMTGVAVLQWAEGDLDVEPGTYEGEIEVVKGSGLRETLYDKLKFRIRDDFA